MLLIELQCAHEGLLELGKEVQGTAQKSHMSADGLAAGKSADSLVDYGLENGGGKILPCGALVDQGLDVRLGENAAAGRDRVERAVAAGKGIQPRRVGLQEAGHLVYKRACAAGTDPVHALFDTAVFKIDDLGVFSAQLDRDVGLGSNFFKGGRYGDDFLNEGHVEVVGESQAAGTGYDRMHGDIAELRQGILDEFAQCALNISVMAAVIGKHDLAGSIQNRNLYGGGSDIDPQGVVS